MVADTPLCIVFGFKTILLWFAKLVGGLITNTMTILLLINVVIEKCSIFNPEDDIEDLNIVYSRKISLSDLGPTPHARHWFEHWLIEWSSEYAWPYPSWFQNRDGQPNIDKPTLQDKQNVRWARIQEEIEVLLRADPASAELAIFIKTSSGTDAVIQKAREMLKALNGDIDERRSEAQTG